ncbi:ABC transporter substrate-binding protein [Pseudonocardia sichuanensis]
MSFRSRSARSRSVVAGFLCTAMLVAGCSSGGSADDNEIVVGLESETTGWLPGRNLLINYPSLNVAYAVFDPLMRTDANGEMRPYLAESLEPNADLTQWTLTLRPGVRFHDGTPLDAQALKTVYDQYLSIPTSNLLGSLRFVESLEVVDDLTVRYTLTEPDASFPAVLEGPAGWPFSPTAAAEQGADAFASQPVGTGPFRFASWLRGSELELERNEDYWREGLPKLDRITFQVITDENARVASLQSGDIDAMQTLRQSTVRQVRALEDVTTHDFIGNLAGGQLLNTQQPPLDDVRVRQALAYAIDQPAILDLLGGSDLSPTATQYYQPDSPWHSERAEQTWPTNDPGRARQLLDEYRNDPNRSDGKAPGEPVVLEHNIIPDPSVVEMGLGYKAMWEAVGFVHNMHQVEVAVITDTNASGDFMINTSRFGNEDDPCITLRNSFGDPEVTPTNYTNLDDAEVQQHLATLCSTTDQAAREQAVDAIMVRLAELVPHTWTGHTPTSVAARPELQGIPDWTFPDGTPGDGFPMTAVTWANVSIVE